MKYQMLEFFTSMYLECVSDQSREQCLRSDLADDYTDLKHFKDALQSKPYGELLNIFKKIMHSKMAIMFQERNRRPLTSEVNPRDIILLDRSNESIQDRIGVLRSELLKFYHNGRQMSKDSQDPPCDSNLLLNIKDEVQIVRVNYLQMDPIVQSYTRDPCVICYIQLRYNDQLSSADKYIYFAFFYSKSKEKDLLSILECLRSLLSFRNDLMQRITKDFSGNLYGKQKEIAWCNAWLSIEKAGAHADSSKINRLIQSAKFDNTNILHTLFRKNDNQTRQAKQLLELIYNIEISMYYRAIMSEGDCSFLSADNILYYEEGQNKPYFKVEHVLQFSEIETDTIKVDYTPSDINNAYLYGKKSICKTQDGTDISGVPVPKEITCRSRYLRAFMVDILNNITKHAKEGSVPKIYLELGNDDPGYLVFANEVKDGPIEKIDEWCTQHNYTLKQSAEFDHADNPNAPKGISLGCIAHCMSQYGNFIVQYAPNQNRAWFYIKLPIIKNGR